MNAEILLVIMEARASTGMGDLNVAVVMSGLGPTVKQVR